MAHVFPINYFVIAFSAIKSFTQRHYLKHWQKVIVIILLHSLLMIPLSLQLGRATGEDLSIYVPEVMEYIDQTVVDELNTIDNEANTLLIEEVTVIKENQNQFIALAPSEQQGEDLLEGRSGVIYTPDQFIIINEGRLVFEQPYTGEKSLNHATNSDELKQLMSQQWFWSNRTSIILTNYIHLNVLVITSLILLIVGASFFISLMRKNDLYSINSYNEALTIVLNCLGLPSLIAMLVGLVNNNPITLLTTQGLLFVLMVIWVYWKTHFNDEYVQSKA